MSEGLSRLLVAAAAIPVVLGLLYLGGWWAFALAAVAAAVALHEFWLLARPLSPLAPAGYVGGLLALARRPARRRHVDGRRADDDVRARVRAQGDLGGAAGGDRLDLGDRDGRGLDRFGLGFLILVRDFPDHGRLAAFAVVLAVWAGDTFAYFGGRLLGRHKLAPATSPGKTWEGFVFGTVATMFVAFVALYKHDEFLSIGQAVALGAVLAVASPLGDLFESLLKRDSR